MRVFWAIILASFTAGALDLLSAFASYVPDGASVTGVLHYIASGLIGARAMTGGISTAALGLAAHFALTTAMAAIYFAVASRAPAILARPWLFGCLFGLITYVAMVYVVVPYSGVSGWDLPKGWPIVSGVLAHCFFVGAPIAHYAKHFLAPPHAVASSAR
jgi:hypothetical protein